MIARPLRIAFVDYVLEPDKPGRSGLSDIVWDMASELVNQGHEAHVVASYATTNYPDPRVVVHNFPTPPIGYRNVVGHFWILKRAADIVRKIKPDIVHAPEYTSTALFRAFNVPAPVVLTVPGNIFHKLATPGGSGYEWYYAQILKWAARVSARRCAAVIAISREMKRWWEWTGTRSDRIRLIPLGVDPRRFHFVSDARDRLGLPADSVVLVYAGRFSPEKGLTDLIDALGQIRPVPTRDRLRVVLIGQGMQARDSHLGIAEMGLGEVVSVLPKQSHDELVVWYSAADALLLPSRSEGLSRSLLEAMMCGTPVIGSRVSGTEDHLLDGITGYGFPAGQTRLLSDIIRQIVTDPRGVREMRPGVVAYATETLTWESIVSRIVSEVYVPIVLGVA